MLFITGITGLTGRFLLDALREVGYTEVMRCLVREHSDVSWIEDDRVVLHKGDVNDVDSLIRGLHGATGVIHLVNIRSSPQIIQACRATGVRRVVFVNTTGVYSKYQKYSADYKRLEHGILSSGLDYTIIRPTMIYGNHRDKNIHKLVKIIDKYPVIPIIGAGTGLMQPIYAQDLARVIAAAYINPGSIGKAYNVAGKRPIKCREVMELIASRLGKRRFFIRIPYFMALLAGYAGDAIPNGLIDSEKVKRLQEDKVFDYGLAASELGFAPRSFEEGVEQEISDLRKAGIIG
ncbi:MAG: NAD(P)H-binding protein [Syntrophomonadaceae bacterium]|nr:NAD(P)H-binding protein [Syntrophomonadaceae bacterium]